MKPSLSHTQFSPYLLSLVFGLHCLLIPADSKLLGWEDHVSPHGDQHSAESIVSAQSWSILTSQLIVQNYAFSQPNPHIPTSGLSAMV